MDKRLPNGSKHKCLGGRVMLVANCNYSVVVGVVETFSFAMNASFLIIDTWPFWAYIHTYIHVHLVIVWNPSVVKLPSGALHFHRLEFS